MSLLSVTVKKAQFVGAQAAAQWNSYVTLKLQHVKSTTVTVKGANPSWEQDFLFEVNNLDAGLLIEVWNKGLIWDKAAGYHWLHLRDIQHSNVEGTGQWLPLEAELVMRDGEVVGTKTSTGHAVLIDARFELPYANDLEGDEALELQRKLEMLNSMLDQEARVEQGRKQHQYYIQSGVSEDSDYTSDVNYPIGQHPNSSASQFLSAANQLTTPQRSLNSSRENSYEKDDDYYRTNGQQHSPYYPSYPQSTHRKQLPTIPTQQRGLTSRSNSNSSNQRYWDETPRESETDPLYYNSRPQSNYKSYSSYRRRNSWEDEYNQKRPEKTQTRQYSEDYQDAQEYSQPTHNYAKRLKNNRRGTPNLERQYTLYDGGPGDYLAGDEDVQDANCRSIPYVNDRYSTSSAYNQQNAHKDSVYDDYNQQYSDYVPEDTAFDDGYVDNQSTAVISGYDQYANDITYPYDGWNTEQDARDQYTTTASSSKPNKELPQLPTVPTQYHRQTPSQNQSPYASQSTVKEVSIASSIAPSIITSRRDDSISTTTVPSITTSTDGFRTVGYGKGNTDGSFYDDTNYNNHTLVDHSSSVGRVDAVVPAITPKISHNDSEQYMDAYEDQTGYEDWQNYGYYDDAGNYILYDQNSYYDESGNLISGEIQQTQTKEKDQYGYYDQTPSTSTYDPQTHTTTTTTDTVTATKTATTSIPTVKNHESEAYSEQYEDAAFYNSTEGDQQYYDANDPTSYNYDQDAYWYDGTKASTTAFDEKQTEPSHSTSTDHYNDKSAPRSHLESQSSVEYNYAYQSAENLSSFETGPQNRLEKSESISRRASFRRQTSTRDYALTDGVPPGQPFTDATSSYPTTTAASTPAITTTTATAPVTLSTTTTAATPSSSAAAAANKFTSEIKSALPQLSSLTKGKTDLFSSSFSKLGSFVSSAAAKTGVSVPMMSNNKDANKEKDNAAAAVVKPPTAAAAVPQANASVDQGLGHSIDETQYNNQHDQWNGHYEDQHTGEYPAYDETRTDRSFEQYEGEEDGPARFNNKGPVHMDSLESNASEGARDADDLEAEYWQKQKERIAKQASLVSQDSQDFYQYDPYSENKSNLLQPVDSTDDKAFGRDEYTRQESLDREEWLRELEKQSGGQIRPSLSKKDTVSMSLDRSESIDQQSDYGDEYGTDQERRDGILGQDSLESGDRDYPLSPPPSQKPPEDTTANGQRKSSLEIQAGKEKGSKSVSFEEDPPKLVPERQTKGMTPREKWLWATNRICAQIAVSLGNTSIFNLASCFVLISSSLIVYYDIRSHNAF